VVEGVNFGNFELGEISGIKFDDANGNGVRDDGETGLLGWTIYIDQNGNGELDDDEAFTSTDSDGAYSFTGLTAGSYVVREVVEADWAQTMPDGSEYSEEITSGAVLTDRNFGNRETIPPTVESAETMDRDGNGQIDAIKLTFSENIDDSRLNLGEPDGWDVDGAGAESIGTGDTENDNVLLLAFGEGPTPDTGNIPTVTYTPSGGPRSTHDLAGNELGGYEGVPEDKANPVLLSAVTGDGDANGQIDRMELTFSENIDDEMLDTESNDGWDVNSYSGEVIGSGEDENDNLLVLYFDENESGLEDTATTPAVSYTSSEDDSSTHDLAGNELNSGSWSTNDGAAPISSIADPLADSIHNSSITISGSSSDADILGDTDTVNYTRLYYKLNSGSEWTEISDSQRDNELGEEPFGWTFEWTPGEDGVYDIMAEATDTSGNTESSPVVSNVTYDTTAPEIPTATPAAGDYFADQLVELSSADSLSGLATIYYSTDGSDPNSETGTLYEDTTIEVVTDMTIKAIAYDNAGNASEVLTAEYGVAPVISEESSSSVGSGSATITWTTDDPATSRVIYDTVSHPTLGESANYGYANSTVEADADPKVTAHSVAITGLTAGTTYYYRTVSHGSPEAVGDEQTIATTTSSSTGTTAGTSTTSDSGGGGSTTCGDTKPGSAPTLLSATAGFNSVTLTWSAAADPISYYLVAYGTTPGSLQYGNPNIGGKGMTSFTVSNLSGGTRYYFRIRAGNGCMPGDYSNELGVTPSGGFVTGPAAGFAEGVLGVETEITPETTVSSPVLTPFLTPKPTSGKVLGQEAGKWNWWWLLLIIPVPAALLWWWSGKKS